MLPPSRSAASPLRVSTASLAGCWGDTVPMSREPAPALVGNTFTEELFTNTAPSALNKADPMPDPGALCACCVSCVVRKLAVRLFVAAEASDSPWVFESTPLPG